MAFNQNDLYLVSGTGQLINSWVDPVYKFDSSSFYNWEQDNLPIYDLEDRDDELWEKAGYPTSSTAPSIMLTVSSCGVDNKKVFSTLSGALEVLPNTITVPVIIEVCASGALGDLRLENKEISPSGGGLEIINRGFAKMMCGSGASTEVSSFVSGTNTGASDGSSVLTVSSLDTSNAMADAFSVGLSGVRLDSGMPTTYGFWKDYIRAFVITPEWSNAGATSTKTVSMSSRFSDTTANVDFLGNVANAFNVVPYSDNSVSSDIEIVNGFTNAQAQRPLIDYIAGTTRATGMIYANSLSNVTVKNCSGRIYIRGFCVDGADQASLASDGSQVTDNGFDIHNSEVVIENCTATRCKHAGMEAVNSDVTLNRGFVAYHNYELETEGGSNFLNKKKESVLTPGLRAINSNVTLSSALTARDGCPVDSPFCFTRNMVGVELQNATLATPPDYRYGLNPAGESVTEVNGSETLVLQTFFNVHEGIKAQESLIDLGSRLSSFQNKTGVKLTGSTCKVQECSIDHNQEEGLLAEGSVFNYNKNAQNMISTRSTGPFSPVTGFNTNGQHVVMEGSQFIPTSVSGMDNIYSRMTFSGSFGMENCGGYKSATAPVVVDAGSYMNAVGLNTLNFASLGDTTTVVYARPLAGASIAVTNNSTLDLNGTRLYNTYVIGPQAHEKQQKLAGLYAGQGSTINIAGPTSIVQFGVAALAEDNSTVKISPHEKDGQLDVSGYSLHDPLNHTRVQLHTTRASLVANRSSVLDLHDLGDYHLRWAGKYMDDNPDYPTAGSYTAGRYETSAFTYNGHLQFYANPFMPYSNTGGVAGQLHLAPQAQYPTAVAGIDGDTNTFVALPDTDNNTANDVSSLSYGGMCVRATGASKVHARNVTFPAGWGNPSGPYYDASTVGNCDLLRIWNIADNSELHASYFSVGNSNLGTFAHPQDLSAIYYGPSALWTSDTGTGLSGAPSSTPDTSGASVLDSFGLGVATGGDLGYYGKTTRQNIGPFRIYVSTDPKANFLGYPMDQNNEFYSPAVPGDTPTSLGYSWSDRATLITGPPKQLYAQGYACSGDVSAINNNGATWENVSSIFPDLGASAYINSLPADQQVENDASSFYYTSAMVATDCEPRIWLDESAMNSFANAKNGTLGTSGRKKLFSYYKAITDSTGEAFFNTSRATGIGSINLFDLDRYL